MTDFRIVIPARFHSQRLPGKPLIEIAGKSLLHHVYDRAMGAGAIDVIVATDDERIESAAQAFGASVCMTSPSHSSGTDRIAEVAASRNWGRDDIVVNLQGDEPLMPLGPLQQVARNLADNPAASIATLATPLEGEQACNNPANVKVVRDQNKMALYFSRSLIPHHREINESSVTALRHVGLYAYRVDFLLAYASLAPCAVEQSEKLEQLRALWYGYKIHVDDAVELPGRDVNVGEDLAGVEQALLALQGT
ncbi:MAG: 3-deoxy-manno-octulosonate cytidylyltransferase [Pseudomonadota bacterium]